MSIYMIRKNALFCKLIHIRSSSDALFGAFMASFRPEQEACPVCGSRGNCRIHAYYGRHLVDFVHGRHIRHEVSILRLACTGCGSTHAVIPDFIIPYSSYGLLFVLRLLAEAFRGSTSVESLCERFCITRNQFYHWLALWKQHKQQWLGLLSDLVTSSAAFLGTLTGMPRFSSFSSSFFRKCAVSFLQSHKDQQRCAKKHRAGSGASGRPPIWQ